MRLKLNQPELESLMKDFYVLTGIKMVVFDNEYHELLAYPDTNCAFCQYMKDNIDTRRLCEHSDRRSFKICQKQGKLIIYHCHAGLIEATAPLIDNHVVIGYLMFGQISDVGSKKALKSLIKSTLLSTNLSEADFSYYTEDISLKSNEQIQAAAKIMEACTFYVMFKETISVQRQNIITNMNSYLNNHLHEDLNVGTITHELGISKSKLYQICDSYLGCGIAEYIKNLRIERAKDLLKNTDLPIIQIAEDTGFSDYNYFCRVFKKEAGIPAKKYRASF